MARKTRMLVTASNRNGEGAIRFKIEDRFVDAMEYEIGSDLPADAIGEYMADALQNLIAIGWLWPDIYLTVQFD